MCVKSRVIVPLGSSSVSLTAEDASSLCAYLRILGGPDGSDAEWVIQRIELAIHQLTGQDGIRVRISPLDPHLRNVMQRALYLASTNGYPLSADLRRLGRELSRTEPP
jgi:hypothetical protein